MDDCVAINIIVNFAGGNSADGALVLSPLVFNVDDIRKLRKLGICGILAGTLPSATQQNLFLSVPLKLMVEEAIWLHINGFAKFRVLQGPSMNLVRDLLDSRGFEIHKIAKERLEKSFQLQREYKKEQHMLKLERLGIKAPNDSDSSEMDSVAQDLMEASFFVETPSTSNLLSDIHLNSNVTVLNNDLVDMLISQFSDWDNFLLFQALKNQGYVLSPGARFGGKYIAYPGDPLRYHSHLVIRDALHYKKEPIDFLELAAGARLGTTVKKLWVLGGVNIDDHDRGSGGIKDIESPVSFYSVEWAGFG